MNFKALLAERYYKIKSIIISFENNIVETGIVKIERAMGILLNKTIKKFI
jgi:hypothetical protein